MIVDNTEKKARDSQTRRELNNLEKESCHLDEIVAAVEERLVSVLTDPVPSETGVGEAAEMAVPLADEIRSMRHRISRIRERGESILERLEV